MIKTVTCGENHVRQAAMRHNVSVIFSDIVAAMNLGEDVRAKPTNKPGEHVLEARTLAGQLFLSLLVAGV